MNPPAPDASGMGGVLMLGPARCGSTLISRMLALHPAVLSLSETFATLGPRAYRPAAPDGGRFWRALAEPLPGMSRIGNPDTAPDEFLYHHVAKRSHDPWHCPPLLSITLPHLFNDPDPVFASLRAEIEPRPQAPLAEHYFALFRALAARRAVPPRVWAERSGGSLAAAPSLTAIFPDARIIVLLRNGPDTALSLRDYLPARLAIWLWRFGLDPMEPGSHLGRGARWEVMARLGGVMPLNMILRQRPSAALCGRFWSALMLRGEAALQGRPFWVMRHETTLATPQDSTRRLGLLVAGEAPADWLSHAAALPERRPSRLATLEAAEREALLDACAPGEAAAARLEARAEA